MSDALDETPRDGNQAPDPLDGWIHRDELTARIDARIRRRVRTLKGIAALLATGLLGAIGGIWKAHGDGRAAAERVLVRIEVLEREVDRLRDRPLACAPIAPVNKGQP